MADTNDNALAQLQQSQNAAVQGQTDTMLPQESFTAGTQRGGADAEMGATADAQTEELKDKVDGAVTDGVTRADATTGGRVMVGETGDLRDLAAKRQANASSQQ